MSIFIKTINNLAKINPESQIDHRMYINNYETFNEAKLAIFEFIESWYNNQRIHSSLGYITPNQKYNNYIANLATI